MAVQTQTDPQERMSRDIRIIRGWMVFFGILTIVGLVAGIVFGFTIAHDLSHLSQGTSSCPYVNGC